MKLFGRMNLTKQYIKRINSITQILFVQVGHSNIKSYWYTWLWWIYRRTSLSIMEWRWQTIRIGRRKRKIVFDYIRLIKEKRPKFFLIENVQGIINDKHFSTFLSFLSTLEDAGYVVSYSLLNAADYHIPKTVIAYSLLVSWKSWIVHFTFQNHLENLMSH